MKPRALCISFSDISADSRVLRQIAVVADACEVTTLSYGPKPAQSTHHLEIDSTLRSLPETPLGVLKLLLRLHRRVELTAPAVTSAIQLVGDRKFDLVIANEARALPLAHRVAGDSPIWGDMHEWAPAERTQLLSWRILVAPYMEYVCKRYLPITAAVTTVNSSIARLYDEQFNCSTQIVRNAVPFQDLVPSAMLPGKVRLVHSGGAVPGRNIEGLIEAMALLDNRFTLDLYLVPARDAGRYQRKLQDLASHDGRIVFHDPVSPSDLPAELNKYDVGVYQLPPATVNQRLALPNKFFDFVQARLCLAFGPSIEIEKLVQHHELGIVTTDFGPQSLADALSALSEREITDFKESSGAAAHDLSSAKDVTTMTGIISSLLQKS